MDEINRIKKDLDMFETNLAQFMKNNKNLTDSQNKTLELAKQYYNDSKYYLEKKDYFTAFGCINYAHGLLDAIIKF
jgi:hypothetical protein